MKKKRGLLLSVMVLCVTLAFLISNSISQQKPIIAKSCSLPGCHTAKPNELYGNLKTVSAKAEMIQLDTGALWTVKFDQNTKLKNWNQPINKIPKEKEIAITYVEKNGELYATLINVKPPVVVDPAKVIKVSEMKKIFDEKKGVIIDCRPAGRYNEGHIPGSINIWYAEFDKHIDKLPPDKNTLIVYYCQGPTCALTPSSARRAEALGYTNVKQFVDGMPEWKKQGYPVASTLKYLKELIEKDIPHVLIDVRTAEKAKQEHIPGAVNIPLAELQKSKNLFPKQENAPILIYCDLDKLSQQAFDIVRKWGYINTSYVVGGLNAWKQAGGQVVSDQLKKQIVYVPKPKPGTIGEEEFKKIVGKPPKNVFILDVRDPEETQMGMLKDAKNIPVNELKDRLSEIPKDKEIIIHCATGMRAEMAYNILKEAGYNAKFLDANIQIREGGKYEIIKE